MLNVAISQIANHFVGQSADDFILQYNALGFEKSLQDTKTILQKENFDYIIFLEVNGQNSTLLLVQNQKNLIVATVEKAGKNVVVWSYEVKENQ